MRRTWTLSWMITLLISLLLPDNSQAQDKPSSDSPATSQDAKPTSKDSEKDKDKAKLPKEPVVSHHEILVGARTLKYTATAGLMPLRDAKGDLEAEIFYIAYTLDAVNEPARRPLMFSFNGGPGSASVWLHLGALGPKRIPLPDDASVASPPYRLIDNDQTWLDQTDLVFIDPVGTGYSRAVKPDLNKKFHSLRGDIESVGEFIRMY